MLTVPLAVTISIDIQRREEVTQIHRQFDLTDLLHREVSSHDLDELMQRQCFAVLSEVHLQLVQHLVIEK
jgi:hypothetical protein